MPAPTTREELEATTFFKAGAEAAREKRKLTEAIACMHPGCWQYDAFVQGFDSFKRPSDMAFIISNDQIVARVKTKLKNGSDVRYSSQRAAEGINAGRAWNLVNARWGKLSDAAKWQKRWEAMPGEAQSSATEINPGDFYIS